jgi:hypothetical protein
VLVRCFCWVEGRMFSESSRKLLHVVDPLPKTESTPGRGCLSNMWAASCDHMLADPSRKLREGTPMFVHWSMPWRGGESILWEAFI